MLRGNNMRKEDKTLVIIGTIFGILLLVSAIKLLDISVTQADALSIHEFNPRLVQVESSMTRGNFYDYNGVQLTENIDDKRNYIYDSRYMPIV